MTILRLHDYWRSTAAYRVRIALNLKGVGYDQQAHDLRTGGHVQPDYINLNPQGLVPALAVDETVLTQSPAILEWLEERWPVPPLLPPDADGRAIVRAMTAIVCCDIHPINNLRVLNALRNIFGANETQVEKWIAHWIALGFDAFEQLVARHGCGYAYGDSPTMADCVLVPQIYSAERFGVDLAPYPALMAAGAEARVLQAFADAHPQRQPDAPAV